MPHAHLYSLDSLQQWPTYTPLFGAPLFGAPLFVAPLFGAPLFVTIRKIGEVGFSPSSLLLVFVHCIYHHHIDVNNDLASVSSLYKKNISLDEKYST